jgi:hypothetical protein
VQLARLLGSCTATSSGKSLRFLPFFLGDENTIRATVCATSSKNLSALNRSPGPGSASQTGTVGTGESIHISSCS